MTVVAKDVCVGKPYSSAAGLPDHLPADIDRVNLAKVTSKRPRNPPGAASYFQDAHLLGIPALTNIAEVVQDVFLHGDLSRPIKLRVRPFLLPGEDIMARIFVRA